MRKLILLLTLVALAATKGNAYEFTKYEGAMLYKMSPDGCYYADSEEGSVVIYHAPTGQQWIYEGDETNTNYAIGGGNSVSDQGIVVGKTTNRQPAYWQNGEWTALPLQNGVQQGTYSIANGITPDGNYICGCVATASFTEAGSRTTYFPVVWSRSSDGTYGTYEFLPYPEKDFCNRSPQYITAIFISDDGSRIVGQVKSSGGWITYPIVYDKDSDGKWSYTLMGLDKVVDTSVTFPPYPTYEPDYPDASDYMTTEDEADYEAALAMYQDSINMYYAGLITERPQYPQQSDYMTYRDKYMSDMARYEEEYTQYYDSISAFEDVYYSAITGGSFEYNDIFLSANGKYMSQTVNTPDPNADIDDWTASNIYYPVLFDVDKGEIITEVEATSMMASSVTDDGMMLAHSPAVEYTRNAYVIPSGANVAVKFEDWIETKCQPAVDWLFENMTYDVTTYTTDPLTYETIETVVEDSLVTGSMSCNSAGTRFMAYVYDYWQTGQYTTYTIDIENPDVPTGIKAAMHGDDGSFHVAVSGGNISVSGDLKGIALYDMQGRQVANAAGKLSANVPSGVYTIKATNANGTTTTRKVCVGRK